MNTPWWSSGLWFGLVGATAAAVHLLVFELTRHAVAPELANLAGFLTAFGVSFVGHRWLSFRGTRTGLQQSLWRFFVTAVAGAAVLLAAFVCTGTSFLAFAVMAEKRGLKSTVYPSKSFYYLGGLTEGTETILCFLAMCLWPQHFAGLAYFYAVLCAVTSATRPPSRWCSTRSAPHARCWSYCTS